MFLNKLKYLFLLCLFAGQVFAISDGGNFLIIPSADVLSDKAFQARGTFGYHQSSICGEKQEMCNRYPFIGAARFGYSNFLDFGVQFGSTVSLDIKNRVVQGYSFVPDIAIGARAFVQSPEAYFYSVPKSARREQTGELYAAFGWDSKFWNILGGVSAFSSMNADAVAPFWGIEQRLGSKFGIVYEGFFRHGASSHNAGLAIMPVRALQINLGATEFYRYFFTSDGDFKMRSKNAGASTGYKAPGIYVSVAINALPSNAPSGKPNIYNHEERLAAQSKEISELRLRIAELERIKLEKELKDSILEIQTEFDEIVKGYFETDLNLDSLRAKEELFMGKGLMSKVFVLRESQNKSAEASSRITAIRIMSHFPDSIFIEPLGSITVDALNEEVISREAALALGVINTAESRNMLAAIVNLTSGAVRKTIMDIIGEL